MGDFNLDPWDNVLDNKNFFTNEFLNEGLNHLPIVAEIKN